MRNTFALLAALLITTASSRSLAQTGRETAANTTNPTKRVPSIKTDTSADRVTRTTAANPATTQKATSAVSAGTINPEDPGKIEGKVGSSSGQPIESATIALLNAKDSSVVKVTSTNKAGQFHFNNLPAGKYIISATSVGYGATLSQSFEVTEARTSRCCPQ
ncbi:carboxypeptidase-like regulatory domain-containing protein [Puia sp. P3]|uniref:carboxypeptidase-like regulatory domain-containing protein n=1 Tax=Puia sp. P3 TaxID=3423952 RepID=UPI003D6732A3